MPASSELNFRGHQDEVELLETERQQLADLTSDESLRQYPVLADLRGSQAPANISELMVRAERAFHLGCYIETMSLFVQHMELWLRVYRAMKLGKDTVFEPGDRKTFGQLVEECAKLGFDQDLVKLMRNFNTYRNRVIHAFVAGRTDYEFLRVISARYSPVPAKVGRFVRQVFAVSPTQTGQNP